MFPFSFHSRVTNAFKQVWPFREVLWFTCPTKLPPLPPCCIVIVSSLTMEDIRGIINSIVKGCAQAGLVVPDVLAGFVARTVSVTWCLVIKRSLSIAQIGLLCVGQIVETNASYFALDRKATPEQTQEVIMQSIEKLLEKDSPALEMYAGF